ncbi:MAG: galactose-1-phosphate uridylyltransferase [Candidatus Sungiibacteriota bacterium]
MTRVVKKSASPSELRQDIVSGDWVAIATARAKRPHAFIEKKQARFSQPKSICPFETLHSDALLTYARDGSTASGGLWWVQAIPNKYPAFGTGQCAVFYNVGPYQWTQGAGFHEVIVTRDHTRSIALMSHDEVCQIIRSYQERAVAMHQDKCIKYISVFHNHGRAAGASISHPHSQMIALPVVPPDVARSVRGSAEYFRSHHTCVHCAMVGYELKEDKRVIYENDHCVVIAPYASKTAFEMRIFPKKHRARFEEAVAEERASLADALRISLAKLFHGIGNPDFNFFIHTAPAPLAEKASHYHWHLEIMPKTAIWAGFEIGTGIEISAIAPEDAAAFLRKIKV